MPPPASRAGGDAELDEITEAVLLTSRALVAVAARSLAATEGPDLDVTLPQFRALVVVATRGPVNAGYLADELGVHPSSVTRLCDRLTNKGLLERAPRPESRREIVLSLTPAGRRVVDEVTASRRRDIRRIVSRVPRELRPGLVQALQAFADAAGEVPEQSGSQGWHA
jgi:DNA-binding MarR family transcriptional regulator